jgi:hypothetical protein
MGDRRAMNGMTGEIKLAHLRLEAWGKWAKDSGLRAWPELSILGRLIEQGANGAAQQGSQPSAYCPPPIEATEVAVNRLGAIDKKVVICNYVLAVDSPVEAKAKRCRMRVKEFQNVLGRARFRVRCYTELLDEFATGSKPI